MPRGEDNPRAKLSDDEVEMLRSLHEEDKRQPRGRRVWTAALLAEKFEISVRHVYFLLSYSRR